MTEPHHVPVLLQEAIEALDPRPGQVAIDATLGAGGHSRALLDKVGTEGRVIGIDADDGAVEKARAAIKQVNFTAVQGNFSDLGEIAEALGLVAIDGILFDFGFSSDQLDSPERGFSFQIDGPLDMRLNLSNEFRAIDIVNTYEEKRIAEIITTYGEEINAKKIAKAIIRYRNKGPVETTGQLFEIIKHALPGQFRHKAADVARRTFQALRIEVNKELEVIEQGLSQAFKLLKPGGRMAAISFHSLEDRIVKKYFASLSRGCICPPEFPVCRCGHDPEARLLTPKPILPSLEEQAINSRSKSAKLRAIQKV